MRLRAAFAAASGTGLLPVFGYALMLVLVIGAVGGGWVGKRWQQGANAIAANAQLRADATEWARIAQAQRELAAEHSIQFDQALARLSAIAQGREDDRKALRAFAALQHETLQQLLELNPAVRELDLGPDVLRHWNKANAGPGTAAPAAGPAGQPAAAVPGAAAGEQQQGPGAAGQPRRGGAAVPRLRKQQRAPDPGGGRVAGHRVAVVLPDAQLHAHRRRRLPA